MIFDHDLRIAHNAAEDAFPGQTVRVAFPPAKGGWFAVVVGDDRGRDLYESPVCATLEMAIGTLIDAMREVIRERYAAE